MEVECIAQSPSIKNHFSCPRNSQASIITKTKWQKIVRTYIRSRCTNRGRRWGGRFHRRSGRCRHYRKNCKKDIKCATSQSFSFKMFGQSREKQYLCTNKSHHASRRKTSGPGWDVSFVYGIYQTAYHPRRADKHTETARAYLWRWECGFAYSQSNQLLSSCQLLACHGRE